MLYAEEDVIQMLVNTANSMGESAGARVYAKIDPLTKTVNFYERGLFRDRLTSTRPYKSIIDEARNPICKNQKISE